MYFVATTKPPHKMLGKGKTPGQGRSDQGPWEVSKISVAYHLGKAKGKDLDTAPRHAVISTYYLWPWESIEIKLPRPGAPTQGQHQDWGLCGGVQRVCPALNLVRVCVRPSRHHLKGGKYGKVHKA